MSPDKTLRELAAKWVQDYDEGCEMLPGEAKRDHFLGMGRGAITMARDFAQELLRALDELELFRREDESRLSCCWEFEKTLRRIADAGPASPGDKKHEWADEVLRRICADEREEG